MYRFELNCSVVGEGGLEPPRPEGHWHLKPARLPFRHSPVAADCSAGMPSNWDARRLENDSNNAAWM